MIVGYLVLACVAVAVLLCFAAIFTEHKQRRAASRRAQRRLELERMRMYMGDADTMFHHTDPRY